MTEPVKVTREHFTDWEESWGRMFRCPKCGANEVYETYKFCPMCGVGLIQLTEEELDKWEDEEDEDYLKEAAAEYARRTEGTP